MVTSVRVDNRLIHGQVVEAWLPHWKVRRLVVADDETASDELMKAAMGLAVPDDVEVHIVPLRNTSFQAWQSDAVSTLVLVREIDGVMQARARGLALREVNVGNVHFAPDRKAVTPSVFLSLKERETLQQLEKEGIRVVFQSVPSEKPLFPSQIHD